jgi:hypothetical protein
VRTKLLQRQLPLLLAQAPVLPPLRQNCPLPAWPRLLHLRLQLLDLRAATGDINPQG